MNCEQCPFVNCCPFVGQQSKQEETFKKPEDKQVFMPSNIRSEILNG